LYAGSQPKTRQKLVLKTINYKALLHKADSHPKEKTVKIKEQVVSFKDDALMAYY